ncbi:MAG: hypothetical protein PHF00_01070, partial [Elusimicrobia bacterium]|nr:hypothetical protein [Elusimicrobiota bacterium]
MLKVCYGPFHPDLEEAFAARLAQLAARRARVLVVAPSRLLADRLQRLAAVEKGLAVADVHFHTFSSLALEATAAAWGGARLLSDPVFHDRV